MRFLNSINSKVIFCAFLFIFSQNIFSQKKGNKNKILSFSESIYESLKYRSIGPFRGGRSAAVTGVKNSLIYIILEPLAEEYGKQRTGVRLIKIFLMVILEVV